MADWRWLTDRIPFRIGKPQAGVDTGSMDYWLTDRIPTREIVSTPGSTTQYLNASIDSTTTVSADVEITRGLSVTISSTTSVSAVFPTDLSAVISSISSVSASLNLEIPLSAGIHALTLVTATMASEEDITVSPTSPLDLSPYESLLPEYQVLVINSRTGDLERTFDLTNLEARYTRVLNGIGSVVLTLTDDPEYDDLFLLDNFVEIWRQSPITGDFQKEETYLVRQTHRFREDDRDFFLVGGQSLNHLFKRRIIDPYDDPLVAGGYSTKDGTGDEVMRAYIREQMGDLASADRQVPNLTVPEGSPGQYNVGARLRFENLYEVLLDLSGRSGVDFHIFRTSGANLEVAVRPLGVDRTRLTNYARAPFVYLTPLRGNLTDPSYDLDRTDEVTFVYAQGQGQGSSRLLLRVPGQYVADSPYNRIEEMIDSRSSERGQALVLFGEATTKLYQGRPVVQFSFEPTGVEPGNIYRQDWDLGDRVTVLWGNERDLRITQVDVSVEERGESIIITVEDDSV